LKTDKPDGVTYGDVLLPLDLIVGLAADQLLDGSEIGPHGRILSLKRNIHKQKLNKVVNTREKINNLNEKKS
jgi:hypothetical protein